MLILLPPSEGKTAPSRGNPLQLDRLSFPELTEPRAELIDALVRLCRDDPSGAGETLGLGPTQDSLVARNAALWTAPTARADRVYTGVLYDALDLPSLDAAARRRAARWLATTSALFGLVRPTDRIPAYRLSGQHRLPGAGAVATVWARHLGGSVSEARGAGMVLDLRSSAYLPFWRPQRRDPEVVTVRVLHERGGRRTVVSHVNKATKGRLARSVLTAGGTPDRAADLADLLGDLGWRVERDGTRWDVVVTAL